MKGKIISIAQKTKDGKHESFTFSDKTLYVYILNVDINGEIFLGDAYSTSATPPWNTTEEYEITVEDNTKCTGNKKIKIGQNKPFAGGKKGSWGKPVEERMEIISQSSYTNAINYMLMLTQEERKIIFEKYGPDEAYISYANRLSEEVIKNARRLEEEFGKK